MSSEDDKGFADLSPDEATAIVFNSERLICRIRESYEPVGTAERWADRWFEAKEEVNRLRAINADLMAQLKDFAGLDLNHKLCHCRYCKAQEIIAKAEGRNA